MSFVQPSLPFDSVSPPHPGTFVFVRHPRAKRYVIRVTENGAVRVTIPRWGSKREAAAFAAQERGWIENQQRRAEQDSCRPKPSSLSPDVERDLRGRAKRELPASRPGVANTARDSSRSANTVT